MSERLRTIYAPSLPDLVAAVNAQETLFSKIIYFGPNPSAIDPTVAFMAVFDYSYNPVITFEDIMGMSNNREFDITLSA